MWRELHPKNEYYLYVKASKISLPIMFFTAIAGKFADIANNCSLEILLD